MVLLLHLLARLELEACTRHDKWHGVRRVRSVRVTRRGVAHLLSVAVISGDEKYVAVLFRSFVDSAHGFIGSRDGLDSGVVDTSVADLHKNYAAMNNVL